jgi:hypothetical protein
MFYHVTIYTKHIILNKNPTVEIFHFTFLGHFFASMFSGVKTHRCNPVLSRHFTRFLPECLLGHRKLGYWDSYGYLIWDYLLGLISIYPL